MAIVLPPICHPIMLSKKLLYLLPLLAFLIVRPASAQVPSTLNYQGRVAVSGTNFSGTGYFKFALVNSNGSQTFWSNDGTSTAGSAPTAAVSIPVSSGLYSVQLGDTTVPNMTPVPAAVFANNPDVHLRVWFNDGTNGFQLMTPDQKIAAVGYAMMAASVPDGSITAAKLAAGVGGGGGGSVADASVTADKLAPGAAAANLAASGLSGIPSSGVISSTEENSPALQALGFVREPTTMAGVGSWASLPSGDTVAAHTTVWTGTELLIWGGVEPATVSGMSSYSPLNRGVRYNPSTGVWSPISTVGAPQARFGHTAVWTGTEMIVWGGQTATQISAGTVLATGGRYNPATDTWSSMSVNSDGNFGIPDARRNHLAFCTSTEMLVWGGTNMQQPLGMPSGSAIITRGRRYNLAANTWSDMADPNIEMGSPMSHTGVWTGSEMIIWAGGTPGTPPRAGRYNPATNTWLGLPIPPFGQPPLGDSESSAVWTGTRMILWGGITNGTPTNGGYSFDPAANAGAGGWTTISTTGAPAGRNRHYAVWSGTDMIVWGGQAMSTTPPMMTVLQNDGGRYNPADDTWLPLSTTAAPAPRMEATATIAGDKLLVWAGVQSDPLAQSSSWKYHKHGSIYDLASNTWSAVANGSPAPRFGHTAVWTGTDLIVWGGTGGVAANGVDPTFNDGARFNAATGVWTTLPALNAPTGRYGHTAVWTGTEMIIWGGFRVEATVGMATTITLNSGARYNPLTNVWSSMDTTTAPSARTKHMAVWAGSPANRMIVFGGTTDGNMIYESSGATYNPETDSWTPTSLMNAPQSNSSQVAVWSGSEMIITGGFSSGSRYHPISNSWTFMAPSGGFFFGSTYPAAVWANGEMLLYSNSMSTQSLQSYSPIANLWQTLTTAGLPVPTPAIPKPTAVWSGRDMLVWGVSTSNGAISPTTSGARYSPSAGTWTNMETSGAPATPYGSSVWTGSEMLLWGGGSIDNGMGAATGSASDKGHRYRAPQVYYFYRKL